MKTWAIAVLLVCVATFALATLVSLRPAPVSLDGGGKKHAKTRFLTREGYALSVSYQHDWNIYDHLDLHEIPTLLQTSMLYAEDRRFFDHGGIDWTARLHALVQNVATLRPVRGASTITEQTVRLLYPRPRTLWSRWLEGFEARRLERRFSKSEILAFYLNQVPYAANRRGVAQAARYFFDRSVDTLSLNEMLALAVMIRAPSRFNLWRNPDGVRSRVNVLAARLERDGVTNDRQLAHVRASTVTLAKSSLQVQATHFAHYVSETRDLPTETSVNTTLDAALQTSVQALLDQRLAGLKHKRVNNGAVLVVDHRDNVILAWCIGKPFADTPSSKIDAVRARRQPGSTLKPFLYAMALEHGWSAATIIDDAPLAESVGTGLHRYNNYSRRHYGEVTVRAALANSLNIPAVKALQYVGQEVFLKRLHSLGIESLDAHPDIYGDGLALGNGEVSLLELVQAYTVLARGGVYSPLRVVDEDLVGARLIFTPQVTSLIGHILSDDQARVLEFGVGGVLNLPVQTAVKTGTSSDHRDTWALGFNHRYTVGVWMGNLDRTPSDGVTGASGPAFVLRGVFAALNQKTAPRPLYFSQSLVRKEFCLPGPTSSNCRRGSEWFVPGTGPHTKPVIEPAQELFIRHPSNGLRMALDPRIDDEVEQFRFALSDSAQTFEHVEWVVDGQLVGTTSVPTYLWPLQTGPHILEARLWWPNDEQPFVTRPVSFEVR